MRYPVPSSLPTPNSIAIFDGTALERGGEISNTGAVDVYLANKATKAAMESAVDPLSGIPAVGRKLSPGQAFAIAACGDQIFALAANGSGEVEVIDYIARVPCCGT